MNFWNELSQTKDINVCLMSHLSKAFIEKGIHITNTLQAYDLANFLEPYNRFLEDVHARGIDFESENDYIKNKEKEEKLRKKILSLGGTNCFESLRFGEISPACNVCRKAVGSNTYILTLRCNRDCYFCTNRNQDDYVNGVNKIYDIKAQFDKDIANYNRLGVKLECVAITGGEPLLYIDDCVSFVRYVKSIDNRIEVRIYTNGDFLDEKNLSLLKEAGTDELRVGLKQDKLGKISEVVFERLLLAQKFIKRIIVEMPIIPHTLSSFKELILKLNEIGIYGINILEFLYPHQFTASYKALGYKLKALPYSKFFQYTYAGGLPISGSGVEALEAMLFAIENSLSLNIHYCSLENKLTGEIYKRNAQIKLSTIEFFSERDYFIKVARLYDNIEIGKNILKNEKKDFFINSYDELDGLETIDFSVKDISLILDIPNCSISIISIVAERLPDGHIALHDIWAEPIDAKHFNLEDL